MILHSNVIGNGEPFIILHGFLGMGDNLKTLAQKISESNFEVHILDARNHGRSFHDQEFSYEVMAQDVLNYVNEKSLNPAIVLGHSMGGKTAMTFATENPDKVEKLIVADIAPRYYPVHHDAILQGLFELENQKLNNRSEADEILAQFVPDFGTRQFLLKNLYWTKEKTLSLRLNLGVLTEQVSEVGEPLSPSAVYNKPTLFIKGDRSEYVSENDKADIKRHFPKAVIESVSKAGHWLHVENAEEFLDKVMAFVLK
ncbi:Pimeloyl-ACP methyl ester carboxylesterase [Flavobacteriaceae bacterium MAR_2010_188]|nr:Pimeloyl-ACP methyl ester carboxylesterase [Flavobacteriaceae bacterium MAR_2010_188]